MFAKAVNIADGGHLTPLRVDPAMLPRIGEAIPIEAGATWRVMDIECQGHPDKLVPMFLLAADSWLFGAPTRPSPEQYEELKDAAPKPHVDLDH